MSNENDPTQQSSLPSPPPSSLPSPSPSSLPSPPPTSNVDTSTTAPSPISSLPSPPSFPPPAPPSTSTPSTGSDSTSSRTTSHTKPSSHTPKPSSTTTNTNNNNGSDANSTTNNVSTGLVVGLAVGGVLLFIFVTLFFLCCRGRSKKKGRPGNELHARPPKGAIYGWQHNVPPATDHVVKLQPHISPPPAHASRPPLPPLPPPPPPPPLFSSTGDSGSNYSGSEAALPPPSPSSFLGFSKSTFTYEELVRATGRFSDANLLGQGGFGYVHRGMLPNGKEVAVKQLKSGSGQGDREFQAEVETISRVHHKHLVSLVGYCIARDQRLLVYEFVPNNTLEFHLHGKDRPCLDWSTRLKIALGSAKGLAYLHEDCNPKIIHRDIKSANILLDFKFEPKVFNIPHITMDGGYAKAGFLRKRKPGSFGDYSFRQLDVAEKNKRRNFDNENSNIDTLYRMLCPVQKIGSVLGKGGSIVSAIRDETHAKIRVADRIPGAEERVVIIFSHPVSESVERKLDQDSDTNAEDMHFEPHCPAQGALLKVFDRIVEDDHSGGGDKNTEAEDVTIRLLVPHNQVGCLIGKAGDVIQKLRSGTRANIRILGEDHLPICAMASDELVQISGKSDVVKKALYEISTRLHQHPRKETPSVDEIIAAGTQGLYPPGVPNDPMVPPGAPMWPHEESEALVAPHTYYGSELSKGAEDHGMANEFSLKVVCPSGKIGGVIGKGGTNVKQVEQQTGVRIHVEDNTDDSSIRIILISSKEALFDPTSPTIEAILQLQERASEISDKGDIITRLLVPSGKAGCLLGQGGQVINEMRKQTRADIRVCAKGDKPSYASSSEELVQITGNQRSARDALIEIVSRLRERILRDAAAAVNYPPPAPLHRFSSYDTMSKTPSSAAYGDPNMKGRGSTYGDESYRAPPHVSGYSSIYSPVGARYTGSRVPSDYGAGVDNLSDLRHEYGARGRPYEPLSRSGEPRSNLGRSSWSHYEQRREDPWNSYLSRPYRSYGRD